MSFLFVLSTPRTAHLQDDIPPLENLFQFDIGLLGTSFNYELPILKNVLLRLDLGMEFGFFGRFYGRNNINLGINNRLGAEARYYMGRNRRHRLSRVMDANSGFYTAFLTTYSDVSVLTPRYESIFYNGLGLSAVVGYKRKLGRVC